LDYYVRTGVFATEEEIQRMKDACNTPCIMIGGHWPKSPHEVVHEIALTHGLPEINGYYGCDLLNGEFIKV
jgi:hypothetical protein